MTQTGMSPRARRELHVLCGLSWACGAAVFMAALGYLMYELPTERERARARWLPARWDGAYPAAFHLGNAAGAALLGRLGDARGRRPALLLAHAITTVGAATHAGSAHVEPCLWPRESAQRGRVWHWTRHGLSGRAAGDGATAGRLICGPNIWRRWRSLP